MSVESQQTTSPWRLAAQALALSVGGLVAAAWFRAGVAGRWIGDTVAFDWPGMHEEGSVTPLLPALLSTTAAAALMAALLVILWRERRGGLPGSTGASPGRAGSPAWFLIIGAMAVSAVCILAAVRARTRFPLDLLLWSESSFLQDMLKLHKGLCPYQPGSDNNSFVYSPGAPLLTWGAASLFGGYRSLSFCRALQVAFTLVACGLSSVALWQLLGPSPDGRRPGRLPFLALVLFLVVAVVNPVTAPFVDLLHNDALVLLTCAAGLAALTLYGRIPPAWWLLLAVPLPALAVLMKQTGYVVWIALVAGVWIQERRLKPALLFALLSGALIAAVGLALAAWSNGWWWFWTVRVLSKQQIAWDLGVVIVGQLAGPPLVPLALACTGVAVWAARRWETEQSRRILAVLLYGALLTGSSAATSFKCGTAWANHWGPACLVLATLNAAGVGLLVSAARGWRSVRWVNVGAAAWLLLAAASLHRLERNVPTGEQYAYAGRLNRAFLAGAPERTLLDHGTIHYVLRDIIPRDRCNSVLEVTAGGLRDVDATVGRIRSQQYDRILIHDVYGTAWYGNDVMRAIATAYDLKERIPGIPGAGRVDYLFGYLMTDVLVYEPKPLSPADEHATSILYTEPGSCTVSGRAPREVRVKFSGPVDEATVTAETVRLLSSTGAETAPTLLPVPESAVHFDAASNSAVVAMPTALRPGVYWVVVNDAVKDERGRSVAGRTYRAPFLIDRFAKTAGFHR